MFEEMILQLAANIIEKKFNKQMPDRPYSLLMTSKPVINSLDIAKYIGNRNIEIILSDRLLHIIEVNHDKPNLKEFWSDKLLKIDIVAKTPTNVIKLKDSFYDLRVAPRDDDLQNDPKLAAKETVARLKNDRAYLKNFIEELKAVEADGTDLTLIFGHDSSGSYAQESLVIDAADVPSRPLVDPPFEAEAVSPFNAAAAPAVDPTVWGPHLPARPPRLWVERDTQTETDPAVFLGTVYKDWLPWLSRRDIRYIDRTLYFVYAQWLGSDDPKWLDANGEKTPPVEFGGNPRGRMDDAAYGANARERDRLTAEKSRAAKLKNRDKSAQDVTPDR